MYNMKSERNIFVFSLKYAPVMKRHCFAFGQGAKEVLDCNITYFFSSYYKNSENNLFRKENVYYVEVNANLWLIFFDIIKFIFFYIPRIVNLLSVKRPGVVYFENSHPINLIIILLIKLQFKKTMVLHHFHEPAFYSNGSALRDIYFWAATTFQRLLFLAADKIIVSSEIAKNAAYGNFRNGHKKILVVPLLFDDYGDKNIWARDKITFIGSLSKHRGVNVFLEFAKYCSENGFKYKFQLLTKDKADFVDEYSKTNCLSNFFIRSGDDISDREISQALKQSIACFVLHTQVMQSGVLPVCFMNGALPVVRRCQGMTEVIISSELGCFLSEDRDMFSQLVSQIEQDQSTIDRHERIRREHFENVYYYKNWGRYYGWLVSLLQSQP